MRANVFDCLSDLVRIHVAIFREVGVCWIVLSDSGCQRCEVFSQQVGVDAKLL